MRPRLDTVIALGLAAVTLAVRAPLLRFGLNLGDEGMFVEAVERIRAGEVLYRDFHRTYAPGVYYPFVPLFDWFGPSVVLARLVWLGMLAALSALTYLAARPFAARWAALGAGLLTVLIAPPAHKTFVPLAIVCGLLLCRRLLFGDAGRATAIAVGAGIGSLGLLRQEVCAYTFVIAVWTLLARRASLRAGTGALILGMSLVLGPTALLLMANGAVAAAVQNLLLDPPRDNALLSLPFPSLAQVMTGPHRLETSLFWFPLLVVPAAALWFVAGRRLSTPDPARAVALQWILMATMTLSIFAIRSDVPHLTQGLVAPLLLLALLLTRWQEQVRRVSGPKRVAVALGGGLVCLWVVAVSNDSLRENLLHVYREQARGVRLEEARATVVLPPPRAAKLQALLAELRARSNPGDPVFVAPHAPMLYFLSERRNPTAFDMVIGAGVAEPETQRAIARRLEEPAVAVVMYNESPLDGDVERAFPGNLPTLEAYLNRSWVEDRRIGTWVFLRRSTAVDEEAR
jgi:hypothetical protein